MIQLLTRFALEGAPCSLKGGSLLAFPHWYEYLPGVQDAAKGCIPQISALSDIWLIAAAVIDIMLRFASIFAVGIIVFGGVKYIMSQGEPDKTTQARDTIFNALIGLAICIAATFMVNFIAQRFN